MYFFFLFLYFLTQKFFSFCLKILADDVWYFHKFLEFLTDDEKKRLFTEKVLLSVERALKEQREERQALYLPDEE